MTTETYIHLDGKPVMPSFRVPRGEVKTNFDNFTLVHIMHPYDIAQRLGEAGNITQAFAALDGFMHRYIDIQAKAACDRIDGMYRDR